MIDFVVTGTGRSSTKYVAEALSAAGLPCAHEHWCSSWTDDYSDNQIWRDAPRVGEVSWQAAPFIGEMQRAGVPVVHLVRHPIEVASSMVSNRMLLPDAEGNLLPWHKFISAHIGDHIWRLHPHDRALRFWTEWNMQIERPDLRWIVPVREPNIYSLVRLLGRQANFGAVETVPRRTNHWREVERLEQGQFVGSVYDEAMDLWRSYFFS